MSLSDYKICKVVDAHELAHETEGHWRLIQAVPDTQLMEVKEQEVTQPYTPSGSSYVTGPTTLEVKRYRVVRTTRFLIGLDEKSSLNHMGARVESMTFERNSYRESCEKLEKLHREADAANVKLKNDVDNAMRQAASLTTQCDKANTKASELEGQIRKLRAAIGERAFNEILA